MSIAAVMLAGTLCFLLLGGGMVMAYLTICPLSIITCEPRLGFWRFWLAPFFKIIHFFKSVASPFKVSPVVFDAEFTRASDKNFFNPGQVVENEQLGVGRGDKFFSPGNLFPHIGDAFSPFEHSNLIGKSSHVPGSFIFLGKPLSGKSKKSHEQRARKRKYSRRPIHKIPSGNVLVLHFHRYPRARGRARLASAIKDT